MDRLTTLEMFVAVASCELPKCGASAQNRLNHASTKIIASKINTENQLLKSFFS